MPVDRTGAPVYPTCIGMWNKSKFDLLVEARKHAGAKCLITFIYESDFRTISVYQQYPAHQKMEKFRRFIANACIQKTKHNSKVIVLYPNDFD